MIQLDDALIQIDTLDMLATLKAELAERGIVRFDKFKPNGSNIQTNCPFHSGGQERKPSFGVNGEKNRCHCFACGWSGTIPSMVSELFGYTDNGKYGRSWLIKRFNSMEVENRNVSFNFHRTNQCSSVSDCNIISEEELDSYRYTHPYMYERGLTDEIIEQFDIGYDQERECITFPILNIESKCVFVATRSVNTKFFGLPKDVNKPVYQAYRFKSGQYKEAWIVESFLNCLTLWKLGIPAMAMIGTGNEEQYKILKRLPVRSFVLAFDPDEAGRKATARFKRNVKGKIIKEVVYNEYGKDAPDINDLQEKVLDLRIIF